MATPDALCELSGAHTGPAAYFLPLPHQPLELRLPEALADRPGRHVLGERLDHPVMRSEGARRGRPVVGKLVAEEVVQRHRVALPIAEDDIVLPPLLHPGCRYEGDVDLGHRVADHVEAVLERDRAAGRDLPVGGRASRRTPVTSRSKQHGTDWRTLGGEVFIQNFCTLPHWCQAS
jgi:hypothetical protein